jgi:alcohol dehydrogenase YqhD (iron-dependent ADH family)
VSDPPIEFFLLAKRLTLCVFGAENKKNSMIANQSQKKKRKTTNKIIFKKEDDHPPFFVLFPNGKIQLKTQVL